MKNKFFPSFEQDISATLKLCVLTVSCAALISWAVFAADHALRKVYKKIETDVLKTYADAQEKPTIEGKKSTRTPHPQRATTQAKTLNLNASE